MSGTGTMTGMLKVSSGRTGSRDSGEGDKIIFPHWNKEYEVTIPAGTQHGQVLRLANAGVKKDVFTGDLYLKCKIIIPKKLTKKQKELRKERKKYEEKIPQGTTGNTKFFTNSFQYFSCFR
mgnify:CR=1 FL=1